MINPNLKNFYGFFTGPFFTGPRGRVFWHNIKTCAGYDYADDPQSIGARISRPYYTIGL
jgi:hypothetical protein